MLIYSWGNITHARARAHTHTHTQTSSFWLKFSEIVYAPQKKKNQYCLLILHLSLANMGNHKKKKKTILQRMMPQDSRRKYAQREKDPRLSTQAHFLLIQRKWKSTGRALHVCCHAGRWEKKWKDLRELGRIWKGTCTAMRGKITQHLPFSF